MNPRGRRTLASEEGGLKRPGSRESREGLLQPTGGEKMVMVAGTRVLVGRRHIPHVLRREDRWGLVDGLGMVGSGARGREAVQHDSQDPGLQGRIEYEMRTRGLLLH